jgi:hypothetical protein
MGLVLLTACAIITPAAPGQQGARPQPRTQAKPRSQAQRRTPTPIQRRYYERTTTRPMTARIAPEPARPRAVVREQADPEPGDEDDREEAEDSSMPGSTGPAGASGLTDRREGVGTTVEDEEESEDGLLGHYGSRQVQSHVLRPGRGSGSLGNFTAAPIRSRPAPQVHHDYFQGLRSGRALNQNVPSARHRCTPGRAQMLNRRR